MATGLKCPQCGKAFIARTDIRNVRVLCPQCKHVLDVVPPQPKPPAGAGAPIPAPPVAPPPQEEILKVSTSAPTGAADSRKRGPLPVIVLSLMALAALCVGAAAYFWIQKQRVQEQPRVDAVEQSAIQAARGMKQFGDSRSAAGDVDGAVAAYEDALKKIENMHGLDSDSLRKEIEEGRQSVSSRKAGLQQRERQLEQVKIAKNVRRLKEEGDRHLKGDAFADAVICYKTALQDIEKLDGRSHELKSVIEAALAEAERWNAAAAAKKTEAAIKAEAPGEVLGPQKIVEKFGKAVVLIKSVQLDGEKKLMGLGTGFVANPAGLIITCYHVVGGANSASVKTPAGEFPVKGVVGYDIKNDEALSMFSQAAGTDPHCAEAHAGMAAIMIEKKNYDGAIQAAKKALAEDPKSYFAQLILGDAYLERGNTEKAITELRKAIKIDPDQPSAHYNLALAYRKARYPDLAWSECEKLKKLDKNLANQLSQVLKYR